MRHIARLGTLVTLLALGSNFGCSKEKQTTTGAESSGDTEAAKGGEHTQAHEAKNVAGMAHETLLALKFHHDS